MRHHRVENCCSSSGQGLCGERSNSYESGSMLVMCCTTRSVPWKIGSARAKITTSSIVQVLVQLLYLASGEEKHGLPPLFNLWQGKTLSEFLSFTGGGYVSVSLA
ncbi:hypothetical protein E2C01_047720 [Portunus trituberculatus]|uniref:Uncharacterized protein n=1 Tax=Portunus trituberculatus TaxID=210409 RepID=A0A5B7G889_PORTR|nr:hypothetical protein [Portunus trituberculatus]